MSKIAFEHDGDWMLCKWDGKVIARQQPEKMHPRSGLGEAWASLDPAYRVEDIPFDQDPADRAVKIWCDGVQVY